MLRTYIGTKCIIFIIQTKPPLLHTGGKETFKRSLDNPEKGRAMELQSSLFLWRADCYLRETSLAGEMLTLLVLNRGMRMEWTVAKPKMRSFSQSPWMKVSTPNSRGMFRFLGKVVQGHHYSLLTSKGLDVFRSRKNSEPGTSVLQLLNTADMVRPLLQSESWLYSKGSCTEGWSPECCYWEMVGTLNTSSGTDFWWGLWDSGLLPTCFYLVSVRWTILPHYTHTPTVCVFLLHHGPQGSRGKGSRAKISETVSQNTPSFLGA